MLLTRVWRLWPFGMRHRAPGRAGTMPRPSNHTEPRGAAAIARHYLRDLVYGANDGIITTFAVVAGVTGGALTSTAVLVIGAANLAADGLSMGAGNFLAIRANESARRAENLPEEEASPFRHAVATFSAFVTVGAVPLVPYVLPVITDTRFMWSTVLTFGALFAVGAARSAVTEDRWWATGLEMLLLGIGVAAAAYGAGALVAAFTSAAK
jgi:VIT1/CCC1 family predicted Fe2+/Mn2+ transporter